MPNRVSKIGSITKYLYPEDIGDIIFDLNANSNYIFTDAAKTTIAASNDLVYTFNEPKNNFDLIQPTSGARPTVGVTPTNGIKYIYSSDGSRWIRTIDLTGAPLTTLIGLDRDPITIVVFCQYTFTGLSTTRYMFGLFEENSSNGIHVHGFSNATPDVWYFRRYDSATGRSVSVNTTENPYNTGMSMLATRYSGDARLRAFCNGVYKGQSIAFVAQGAPNTISIFTTGANSPTGFVEANTRFYRALMFNKALTDNQLLRLYQGAKDYYR